MDSDRCIPCESQRLDGVSHTNGNDSQPRYVVTANQVFVKSSKGTQEQDGRQCMVRYISPGMTGNKEKGTI